MDNYNINYELLKSLIQQFLNENVVEGSFLVSEITGECKQLPKKNLFQICYNFIYRILTSKNGKISRKCFRNVYYDYKTIIILLEQMGLITVSKEYSIYKHEPKTYTIINQDILVDCELELCEELNQFKSYILQKKNRTFNKYNNTKNVYININKETTLNILKEKYIDKTNKENWENIQKQLRAYYKIQEQKINGGLGSDGRLYSPFTHIAKELRNLIYIAPNTNKTERMVEFDIHATHPYLLPGVLSNMLKLSEENPSHKTNEQINSKIRFDITNYTLLLERCSIEGLDLYTELGKLGGLNIDREIVKKSLLSYLNNEKDTVYYKSIDNIFELAFPYIKSFIKNKKAGKYNIFNIELIKKETSIILPICKEIVSKGLSVISIHDCLMFRESQSEQVMEIITKHMKEKECSLLIWKEKESRSAPQGSSVTLDSYNEESLSAPKPKSATRDILSSILLSCGGKGENDSLSAPKSSLKCAKRERKATIMTRPDGRFEFKKIKSRKNETKDEFKKRLINENNFTEKDFKEEPDMKEIKEDRPKDIQNPIDTEVPPTTNTAVLEAPVAEEDDFSAWMKRTNQKPTNEIKNIKQEGEE